MIVAFGLFRQTSQHRVWIASLGITLTILLSSIGEIINAFRSENMLANGERVGNCVNLCCQIK